MPNLVVSIYEKIKGTSVVINNPAKFTDIKGHVMEQSILKAYQLGLTSGYSGLPRMKR